ncbi:MAG: saccharopine dehydrogenase NADP-binding domain-containing protein [Gammaproteobacteria bacterium]|nr:saccharopine dehydrogenase NADP-binding domain-containing protein [Gammaproteobacteria bacterium]
MKHEIVVFGATSFVGQILCRHLAERFGAGELDWAMAGRSPEKLDDLRATLAAAHQDVPLIVADAADEAALRELASEARVVMSTVGPYAVYGEPLVKVCAESGTDYCDLTGEVQWMRRMIERYEKTAAATGARIVHCCGFDSIPSDLGVFFLQQQAFERFGSHCERVKMRVRAMRGGASGGTVASMMNIAKELAADPALRREMANPYSLCPPDHPAKARQPNVVFAERDEDFDAWVAPFVMGSVNTRVVHRSNVLAGCAYGNNFRYDEAVLTGRGIGGYVAAMGVASAVGSFMLGAGIAPARWVLEKFVPAPGEGPSPEAQEKGFFDLRFVGRTADGEKLSVRVTGDRDPGYGSTAKMLSQAGLCLARDIAKENTAGGFWTPATIFGDRLIERLRRDAGLTFEVLDGR